MSNAELNLCKDTRKRTTWKSQTLKVTESRKEPQSPARGAGSPAQLGGRKKQKSGKEHRRRSVREAKDE